jgi:putative transposase
MKTSRYNDAQILSILRQADGGVPVAELCREHGMSTASFYKWRAKFGGMDASMISQMKSIEEENRRLKKMFAELSMQNELLKEALGKK